MDFGATEMAQWLEALAYLRILPDDLGSISRPHLAANNSLKLQCWGIRHLFWFLQVMHIYDAPFRQKTDNHSGKRQKIIINL